MSDEDLNADQPEWAFSWEQREVGRTIFPEQEEDLVGLGVTLDEDVQLFRLRPPLEDVTTAADRSSRRSDARR